MALLTRWNPFRTLAETSPLSELEDAFRVMRPLMREYEAPLDLRMDVTEDDKAYQVSIDLPGVPKESIEVSIDGARVAVSAEIKRETRKEKGKSVLTERYAGNVYRSFSLAHEIDDRKAQARYEHGVLMLTLPKKGNGRAHRVAVN